MRHSMCRCRKNSYEILYFTKLQEYIAVTIMRTISNFLQLCSQYYILHRNNTSIHSVFKSKKDCELNFFKYDIKKWAMNIITKAKLL